MRGYKFYNNVLGWIAFLIAFIVYQLTLEDSVSLWDCGEFIAASYKLMVVHPPGAPFFLMLGRLFSMMASDPTSVAYWVNTMSAAASAGAVLFTFWIVTYFAKKVLTKGLEPNVEQSITIFGAGFVGALALTFMDSFWFSAVEAEVYALSSFFTMAAFWCALKWEQSEGRYADRWLVLIGLLIGISIGTHLLSLLVIPAVAFIYYFKNQPKPTLKGAAIAFVVGFLILTFIQNIMIPGIPWLMTVFDKMFVNTLGFGFNSGSLFVILLVVAGVIAGIVISARKKLRHVNFAFVTLAYILLGYSSYAMVVIRSSANPPIDMNNPADPFNLLSYINREQYGDRPLLYGPYFNAEIIQAKEGRKVYSRWENRYEHVDTRQKYEYEKDMQTLFPRMGDMQKDGSASGYRLWSGMALVQNQIDQLERQIRSTRDPSQQQQLQVQLQSLEKQKPTFGENLTFFVRYQLGHMYFRYFMWNFAGRQNDLQGHYFNKEFEGNWLSGINFIDNIRLGSQSNLPTETARNKARNKFYFLPLIMGLLGMVFQYKNARNDFWVNLVFFMYTGILIIVFLNMPPYEPRERDYAVVGSFQVFCIWIGMGVLMLAEYFKKYIRNRNISALAATVVAFTAPAIMGANGWDDHDRSGRRLAIDFAINYLESCAPNAILFTNGDNDTYPLWYAQNVEGIRTDIRIINMSLLPTDWYSSILLDKVYDSEPLPLTFTREDLRAGNNNYVAYMENPSIDNTKYYPLSQILAFIRDPEKRAPNNRGQRVNYLPSRNFRVSVDRRAVIDNEVVPLKDSAKIIDELQIVFNKQYMHKGDMVFFDLIAGNAERGWERPIYFTTTTGRGAYYGLEKYFQLEGLTYRLVPIESRVESGTPTRIAEDILYNNIMNKFRWFNMKEKENFFLDEKAYLVPQYMQRVFVQFAADLVNKNRTLEAEFSMLQNPVEGMPEPPEGRKAYLEEQINTNKTRAVTLLDKVFDVIPESILYMSNQAKYIAAVTYKDLGEDEKAVHHLNELFERNMEQLKFLAQYDGSTKFTPYAMNTYREAINYTNTVKNTFADWGMESLSSEVEMALPPYEDIAKRNGLM